MICLSRVTWGAVHTMSWRCLSTGVPSCLGLLGGLGRRGVVTAAFEEPYDVVIVGGGMVGAALAALLGSHPVTQSLRVAILDQKVQPTQFIPPGVPELRVSTLTPATVKCLQRAGAWDAIAPPMSAPFVEMQVWESSGRGHIYWDARDVGASTMGHVAENSLLQAALLAAAKRQGRATEFLWPASLAALHLPGKQYEGPSSYTRSTGTASTSVASGSNRSTSTSGGSLSSTGSRSTDGSNYSVHTERGEIESAARQELQAAAAGEAVDNDQFDASSTRGGLALLVLKDGRQLHSRLVVAADGASSQVRQLAGLRTFGWDYHQRGVVATVTTDVPHATAWQSFLPSGPMALLPTRNGFSNIVWSTDVESARRLEALSPEEFAATADRELQRGAGGGGAAAGVPPRILVAPGSSRARSFPLRALHSGIYARSRLALIGDAAHAVHPLAGQGVNLGFGDAVVLADALVAARSSGQDVGDVLLLEEQYERPRQAAVMVMSAALDTVKTTFMPQVGPLAALRGLGLGAFNWASPLKNQVMKYAMGL